MSEFCSLSQLVEVKSLDIFLDGKPQEIPIQSKTGGVDFLVYRRYRRNYAPKNIK